MSEAPDSNSVDFGSLEEVRQYAIALSAEIERLREALEKAATAMWNSEANMDNEAVYIEEILADCKGS